MTNNATTATTVAHDFTTAAPDDITTAYRAADRDGKTAMRAAVTTAITSAVVAGDMAGAQNAVACRDAMTVDRKSTSEVDFAARIADRRATLVAAIDAIDAGDFTLPDGVTLPDGAVIPNNGTVDAGEVARFVTINGRKSGRGSVPDFIASVVTGSPMKISAMRAAWTASEDYPTAPPSAGAIGAALDRDDDDRYTVVMIDGRKGAVKA